MATLSIPLSARQHRARASGKYAPSEASTAHESDDGYASTPANGTPASGTPKPSASPGGKRRDQKRQSLPTLEAIPAQKPSPLRRRSSPSPLDLAKKPVPKRLTKNYTHMVKDFNTMKKYAKQPSGKFLSSTLCVFCEAAPPRLVFFPCQHRCVCDRCMVQHDITNDPKTASSWTACPVCMSDIKLMLPHTGEEESIYWKWALEYPPTLPDHFREEFKDAARRLGQGSTSVPPGEDPTEPNTPDSQPQSPPLADSAQPGSRPTRSRRSISGSQHSTRRFSLVNRRFSPAGSNATPPSKPQTERCIIL